MGILLDAVLAFFSCVGIWTLSQMICTALFADKANDSVLKEEKIAWMKTNSTIK